MLFLPEATFCTLSFDNRISIIEIAYNLYKFSMKILGRSAFFTKANLEFAFCWGKYNTSYPLMYMTKLRIVLQFNLISRIYENDKS